METERGGGRRVDKGTRTELRHTVNKVFKYGLKCDYSVYRQGGHTRDGLGFQIWELGKVGTGWAEAQWFVQSKKNVDPCTCERRHNKNGWHLRLHTATYLGTANNCSLNTLLLRHTRQISTHHHRLSRNTDLRTLFKWPLVRPSCNCSCLLHS